MAPCFAATKRLCPLAKEIRFAVGKRDDLRSSVWRLWGNKDDLFLAARSQAGQTKISFHASGICRFAVVSQTPRPAISRWTKPAQTWQGITPVFDVIVPHFTVVDGFRDKLPPPKKKIKLIDALGAGTKRIVRIFSTGPDFSESDVLRVPHSAPVTIHGRIHLRQEMVWLVSYPDELTSAEVTFLDRLVSTTEINLKPGSSVGDIGYASMHIFEEVSPRRIIDVQLGPGNIYVEQNK